jgi:hypothetical protein
MLLKEEGNFWCHRLRIIALFESDLNQAKRILIGRKLSHHLEDTNVIGEMQYGSRPGKQCQSAVLHEVLLHDISHLTKIPAAFIENDVIGCYDRLINGIVLLLLQKFSFPSSVIACLSTLWDSTLHFIKTMYGTSDISYSSTSSCPLYGPGQGSTCDMLLSNCSVHRSLNGKSHHDISLQDNNCYFMRSVLRGWLRASSNISPMLTTLHSWQGRRNTISPIQSTSRLSALGMFTILYRWCHQFTKKFLVSYQLDME